MTLEKNVSDVFRLNPAQQRALKKLGIEIIEDLLYHAPARYNSATEVKQIVNLIEGETATIYGRIHGLKTRKAWVRKIPMSEATISDDSGKIGAVWFNQPYIAKMIHEGSLVEVRGKISSRKGTFYLSNPEVKEIKEIPEAPANSLFNDSASRFGFPVYPESRGITSRWFYHAIQKIFSSGILNSLVDPIPKNILDQYKLPDLQTALVWLHAPQKESDSIAAKKRFAFEEIYIIQLQKQKERLSYEKRPAFKVFKTQEDISKFVKRFPFTPTNAQEKAIEDILADMRTGHAMSRLLEGDVGSGKTAVAATTVYAVTTTKPPNQNYGNLQTAYMAPTEILAQQHFESFIHYFEYLGIQIGLITSSGCKKFPSKVNPKEATDISKTQLLKWVENGEIPILIGTHTLIQKYVKFKNLAYIIIDEQHRFGTAQRQKLRRKEDFAPHLLSMTATPIPRTLALTIYGDLDLTLLDEMPAGRKQVKTEIILPADRNSTYQKIRKELEAGHQAYVICPRIAPTFVEDEVGAPTSDESSRSVGEEAKRLKKEVFKEYEIGILHGKLKPDEKEQVMADFKSGKINILVATSVVEVGVNVPNATVILIEGAERFGLAQLHQLRGRVLRSSDQAYCYVFTEHKSGKAIDRLKALVSARNGFELAEFDLAQRGSGELYGRKQWGMSDLAMEGIKNIKMVEAARKEAAHTLNISPDLSKFPLLIERVEQISKEIHFE